MEYKEISKKLKDKTSEFAGLLPQELRDEFMKNAYLCGGAIYSLRHDKEPKDYDYFMRNKEFAIKLIEYFKEYAVAEVKGRRYGVYSGKSLIITKYAVSLGEFQIITRFIGEPEEVAEEFDFKHNQFAYYNDEIHSYTDWKELDSLALHFNMERSRDLCGTILRIPKFVARGMRISKKEMAKILKQLEDHGFDEREQEILEDYMDY